jgi:predicted Zn-dependent protease
VAGGLVAVVSGAALVGAPAVADLRAARARAELAAGHPVDAAALLERAVLADPLRPRLWSDLANAHHRAASPPEEADARIRHLARAAECNRIAIRLARAEPLYHANLGRVLAEIGADPARQDARRDAFAALRHAAELAPTHPLVLIDAGKAALLVRASGDADAYGARFGSLYPAQAPGYALRGAAAMQREVWSEAESHLLRALAADWSRDPGGEFAAWTNLARSRLELGNARGALEAAGRALVLSPGEPNAAALRIRARRELGLEAPGGAGPGRESAKTPRS